MRLSRLTRVLLVAALLGDGCRCLHRRSANDPICRAPALGISCNALEQVGAPVEERQLSGSPPASIGGWYPAGLYALTAATLYSPAPVTAGPTGRHYAATLDVASGMTNTAIDHYRVVQSQDGCADWTYSFSGDTFGHQGDEPFDHLSSVSWACPPCPGCSTKLKYSGTKTSFTLYFPMDGGTTLVEEFTLRRAAR